MATPRILIVEDEDRPARFYELAMQHAGYRTARARNGKEALKQFAEFRPDLILLDLGLADDEMTGFDVLAHVRRDDIAVHVVILTAQTGEEHQLRGFNLGADNYLVKPVTDAQLIARVQAHLRRRTPRLAEATPTVIRYGDLTIDLPEAKVSREGRTQSLGDVEARVLGRLLQTPGEAVKHAELLQIGWGRSANATQDWSDMRALLNTIYRLRAKLEVKGGKRLIRTVPNVGFAIAEPDRGEAL
ncbi:MAG TPA: response regulator transcription factor [Anaerolineales bacterium]|nr:response regulator transcription factor [Anaerolineales bacterium]